MPQGTSAGGRRTGVLVDWRDERGFGFIQPEVGGPKIFVHVSELPSGRRPSAGREVSYVETWDDRGRRCGGQVRYVDRGPRGRPPAPTRVAVAAAAAFLALLTALVALEATTIWVTAGYSVLSLLTFGVYACDKDAAVRRRHRTPESTLHLLALLGGWPGALVAQKVLRHKTIKQPFRAIFWCTVVVNVAALAWVVLADLESSSFPGT